MDFKFDLFDNVTRHYFGLTLPHNIIEQGLMLGKPVSFSKKDIILKMGEPMNKVYLIIKGIVRSYYLDKDGNDVTKTFLQEMSFCIAESFFTSEPSEQGFEAIEDVEMLEFNVSELKKYIFENEILKDVYIMYLEKTIVYKMHRENAFLIKSATERYLDFKREFPLLEKRVNQSYIASYLGITPVSLSRIRRTIREEC